VISSDPPFPLSPTFCAILLNEPYGNGKGKTTNNWSLLNLDIVPHLCHNLSQMEATMNKSSTIRARIKPDLKDKAEHIFRKLGLTTTQAITLFYKQVELRNGLPFDIAIPNETTYKTFDNTDAGRNLVVCESADDMFRKLGI